MEILIHKVLGAGIKEFRLSESILSDGWSSGIMD